MTEALHRHLGASGGAEFAVATQRRMRAAAFVRVLATVFAVVAVTVWMAAAARADSLVFTKSDGNVWLANPDGSGQYQVTLDGTPANAYSSPSEADNGTIIAARGTGNASQLYRMAQNGAPLNTPFATAAPGGPLDPVATRDGSLVTFWGITGTNACYPWTCLGTAANVQVSYADHYVDPSTFNPSYAGWSSFERATWLSGSRQLLFASNGTLWYYDLHQADPVEWVFWSDEFDYNTFGLGEWIEGAASQDGTRLALVAGVDNQGQYEIQLFTTAGDLASGNPPAPPTPRCAILPPDGSNGTDSQYPGSYVYFDSLSWSPDGQSLAFEYHGAIYVASNIGDLSDCSQVTVTKVIDSASDPYWSKASINPGPRPTSGAGSPGGPGNAGTGQGATSTGGTTGAPPHGTQTAGVTIPCSGLGGSSLQSCQAAQLYAQRVMACDREHAGRSKAAHTKDAACRRKAKTAYHRQLALIKCQQVKNKHGRAACVQQARRTK